jgi:hypothetical protein
MSKDTAYSTVPHDDEVMTPAANAEENGRPQSSTSPVRSGGGVICVMVCMVVLLIATLGWAVSETLTNMALNEYINDMYDTLYYTQIDFSATPTINPDLYECLKHAGKEGDYECFYQSGGARCTNKDSEVYIFFSPDGPMCYSFSLDDDNGRFRWDNVPSVIQGLQQHQQQD